MPEMTISQALRRVSKLKGQLSEYRDRAQSSVTHLVDQEPAYLFATCCEQAETTLKELLALKTAIAVTNAKTNIEWSGKTIPLAMAVRLLQELKSEVDWVRKLPVKPKAQTHESEREYDGDKYVMTVKKYVCHMAEAARADRANEIQERFDKLNDIVETTNHKTTILSVG